MTNQANAAITTDYDNNRNFIFEGGEKENQTADFKRSDYRLNLLIGYQFKFGISLGANYGIGLAILPQTEMAAYSKKTGIFFFTWV